MVPKAVVITANDGNGNPVQQTVTLTTLDGVAQPSLPLVARHATGWFLRFLSA
jgi:hypothetical protein